MLTKIKSVKLALSEIAFPFKTEDRIMWLMAECIEELILKVEVGDQLAPQLAPQLAQQPAAYVEHVLPNGDVYWCPRDNIIKGLMLYSPNGLMDKDWMRENKLHRNDGPAVILTNGGYCYCKHGIEHRADGPSAVLRISNGVVTRWKRDGKYYRDDGPTYIIISGRRASYDQGPIVPYVCISFDQ